jgi:signal transduction histidine kinase
MIRDAVGAVPVVLVFILAQQVFGAGGSTIRAVAIVVVMGSALTVRRRWPIATYVAALAMVLLATTGLEFLAIASYTFVAHHPRPRPALVGIVSAVTMVAGHLRYWPEFTPEVMTGDLILILALAVLPVVFGVMVRASRRTTEELRSRNAELVTLREKEAEHAVEAERFRIARELHDVVAHHVSAMTVRARAGGHVASRDQKAAEDALSYIAEAGTETLTAMGAFVGTLRGGQATGDSGRLAPQPGLEDLPDLLEAFRGTGLVVHADVEASPVPVDPALGLNTYRIVQEAMTNAIRHGAAERAWVRVWFTEDKVCIQVDDNGRGLKEEGHRPGHGLIGVGERAALHGGRSRLAASPRGGCRLEAELSFAHSQAQKRDNFGASGAES